MGEILEEILDALIDTAKLLPFLFVTYLVMEYLEHRTEDKTKRAVEKAGMLGPLFGGILGVVPQCGFSAAAASLYSGRVITVGTLLAVFLSTSDEMLPMLVSEGVNNPLLYATLGKALAVKLVYGVAAGFAIDLILRFMMLRGWVKPKHMLPTSADRKKLNEEPGTEHIKDICEQEKCACDTRKGTSGIFKSAIVHTLQITIYILIITLILNLVLYFVGEDFIAGLFTGKPILASFVAGIIGLIPNCAASVAITKLYIEGAIGAGAMLSGLMVGAGAGLLILFRTNRSIKSNIKFLGILYLVGVIGGILAGLLPIW